MLLLALELSDGKEKMSHAACNPNTFAGPGATADHTLELWKVSQHQQKLHFLPLLFSSLPFALFSLKEKGSNVSEKL